MTAQGADDVRCEHVTLVAHHDGYWECINCVAHFWITPHATVAFRANQAREMRIAAGVLGRHAKTDPFADQARGLASTIVGIMGGGWRWDDLADDATKAAATMGAYVGLRWAKEKNPAVGRAVAALNDGSDRG